MKPTVLDSLNQGLLAALQADPSVHLLGEDILDPYGGAFKVTRGCSTAYPDRVIPTPHLRGRPSGYHGRHGAAWVASGAGDHVW